MSGKSVNGKITSGVLRIARNPDRNVDHCVSTTASGITFWIVGNEDLCNQMVRKFGSHPRLQTPALPREASLCLLITDGQKLSWAAQGTHKICRIRQTGPEFDNRGVGKAEPGEAFLLLNGPLAGKVSLVELQSEFCKARSVEDWMQGIALRLLGRGGEGECYAATGVLVE